jgi:hypothetical protein
MIRILYVVPVLHLTTAQRGKVQRLNSYYDIFVFIVFIVGFVILIFLTNDVTNISQGCVICCFIVSLCSLCVSCAMTFKIKIKIKNFSSQIRVQVQNWYGKIFEYRVAKILSDTTQRTSRCPMETNSPDFPHFSFFLHVKI